MSDPLDFLDAPEGVENKPAPVVEQTPEPIKDSGTPEPVVETPKAEPVIPPGYVPLAATLDEREKRQRIEREFEELKRKYEDATKKAPEPLDPLDQEGFERQISQRIESATWDAVTKTTRLIASRHYGEETVKAAEQALDGELKTNPAFFQTIQRQQDPYDFVVRWHKKQQAIAKIGDEDPEAWAKAWAEKNGYVPASAPGAPGSAAPAPATPTPLPKPSLASAPAAAGNAPKVPVGPGTAFEGVFK